MSNPFDTYEAPVDEGVMEKMIRLATEVSSLETTKADIEQELKDIGNRINTIKINELPTLFSELGISEFKLADGSKLKIKEVVAGSIPKDPEKKQAALNWLDNNDCGDLIKTFVELDFAKGQDNFAKNAVALLEENGYEPTVDKGVHAQSLCARVRERLKTGEDLDLEVLGVYVGKTIDFKKGK